MTEQVVLHVGTHKTGSTSLQHFFRDHDDTLMAAAGAHYPPGLVLPASHAELPLLAIRAERTWPARLRFPETERRAWLAMAEAHMSSVVRTTSQRTLVLSHEDLSYLRFDDEHKRLRELLGGLPVKVIVFLRDKAAFLHSYRAQLEGTGFSLSSDPSSFAYVEDDSWLVDHDALVGGYQRSFGATNVEVVDYDATMERDGSVIPVFAEQLGIPRSALPSLDAYRLNRTGTHLRLTEEQFAVIRRRLAEQAP